MAKEKINEICVLVRCGCGRENARWREIDHIRAGGKSVWKHWERKNRYVSLVTPWQRKCSWRMK